MCPHAQIVNSWFKLLNARRLRSFPIGAGVLVYRFFTTEFYTKLSEQSALRSGSSINYAGVSRWNRDGPDRDGPDTVFAADKIFVPINIPLIHWCLAVIDMRARRILYADSDCSVLQGTTAFGERVKRDLLEYLRAHWAALHPAALAFDTDVWTTTAHTVVAQQVGCNDCGVSTCALADFAAADQVH